MNKTEIKVFMEMEVRVVNNEWVVLKDFFNALGRVKEDGTWTNEKHKMMRFLSEINKGDHHQLLVGVKVKKGQYESVECLKIETAPILLTQFKPVSSNRRTEEENKKALDKWVKFMKFVDDLLVSLEVHKYIITDKEKTKDDVKRVMDNNGNAMVFNKHVNSIMAKILGVYPDIKSIKKDELRQYENQTTIDLLECRAFVSEKFASAFEFTGSHKTAGEMALKVTCKKYKVDLK